MENDPTLWMMIGVPASGKSTWIKDQGFDWNQITLVSSDAIVDRMAAERGKTYGEIFKDVIKEATAEMNGNLRDAIAAKKSVVWDQTNLTAKVRAGKLSKFPECYRKVGIYAPTPSLGELRVRLDGRPGKTIPMNIVVGMMNQLELPGLSEGFHEIIVLG